MLKRGVAINAGIYSYYLLSICLDISEKETVLPIFGQLPIAFCPFCESSLRLYSLAN